MQSSAAGDAGPFLWEGVRCLVVFEVFGSGIFVVAIVWLGVGGGGGGYVGVWDGGVSGGEGAGNEYVTSQDREMRT